MKRVAIMCALAAPMAAHAADNVGHWYWVPQIGGISVDNDRGLQDKDWLYGLGIGKHVSNALSLELSLNGSQIGGGLRDAGCRLIQIEEPTIHFWANTYGPDSDEVHLRAIRDARGRIMVVMSHNTDVADSWEREGEDPAFFYQFSPAGYAVGINVLLHAMTH